MTTRLQQAFQTLRASGRKGVVPYITAGDPDLATTYELLVAMARGGATAIELGVPFSDPMADGSANQRADKYMLAVVLFASALFFAGISNKVRSQRQQEVLTVLGLVIFVGAAVVLASYPVMLVT